LGHGTDSNHLPSSSELQAAQSTEREKRSTYLNLVSRMEANHLKGLTDVQHFNKPG
jgi:hypothetical protein